MKTVAAVHTAAPMIESTKKLFAEILPDVRLINITDDSLIQDIINNEKIPTHVVKRLIDYYAAGFSAGADIVFNTCSSVGEIADLAQFYFEKPIIKIDDAMTEEAVANAESIGVLATLTSTMNPTIRLLEKKAMQVEKKINIVKGLAEGAFQALISGDAEKHDQIIVATAQIITEQVDLIILAQGSMARMESTLTSITGKPVISSPRRGVFQIKNALNKI